MSGWSAMFFSNAFPQPVTPFLPRWTTVTSGLRSRLARLTTLLLDPPHPRFRNIKPRRYFTSSTASITRCQHFTPKLFRIHDEHLLAGALFIQTARMALLLTRRRSSVVFAYVRAMKAGIGRASSPVQEVVDRILICTRISFLLNGLARIWA